MSSFVVSSLKKMKMKKLKKWGKKLCYGFTSPAYWKSGKFVCFKLRDLELKLMFLSTLWMVLKNMGLVKKLGPTLYFNDRYWEVIKVWGMVMLLHFSADYCCCPRQIQYCKKMKEGKRKKKNWVMTEPLIFIFEWKKEMSVALFNYVKLRVLVRKRIVLLFMFG